MQKLDFKILEKKILFQNSNNIVIFFLKSMKVGYIKTQYCNFLLFFLHIFILKSLIKITCSYLINY